MSDNLYILDILMIQNVFLLREKQCKYVYSPKNPADLLTMSATNTKTQKQTQITVQYAWFPLHETNFYNNYKKFTLVLQTLAYALN